MAHSLIFHHAAARFRADPSDEPPKLGGTPEGGSSRSSALRDSIRSVKRRTSAWYANAGNARSVAPTASTSSKRAQGVAPKRGVASFTTAATTAIPTQTTPARTSYVATGRIVGPLEPLSQRTRDRLAKKRRRSPPAVTRPVFSTASAVPPVTLPANCHLPAALGTILAASSNCPPPAPRPVRETRGPGPLPPGPCPRWHALRRPAD